VELSVCFFGHELKIFFPIVQTVSIDMVNDHIVRTVHDLSVHPDHKTSRRSGFFPVGVTVISSSSDVPFVWSDPICIFTVDHNSPGTAGDEGTIEEFLGFGVYFHEH